MGLPNPSGRRASNWRKERRSIASPGLAGAEGVFAVVDFTIGAAEVFDIVDTVASTAAAMALDVFSALDIADGVGLGFRGLVLCICHCPNPSWRIVRLVPETG